MPSGFLVVLTPFQSPNSGKLYAGVDRVPYYPPKIPAESKAMEKYIFGDIKDFESNLILSLDAAIELKECLSDGGRSFEVIYCRYPDKILPKCLSEITNTESLGYDVAGVNGDYWSIVRDFSASDWASAYRLRLNSNGLFPDKTDAEGYLRDYEKHCEPDWNSDFDIVEIFRVKPKF